MLKTLLCALAMSGVALSAAAAPVDDARALMNKQDYKAAMKILEKEAAKDDAEAMYYIGEMFHRGLGMNPQRLTGIQWWEKAAYLGNERAMLALGEVFSQGLGVKAEPRQAYVWVHKAAVQGNAQAQFEIGNYFAFGNGVAKDPKEADKWYRRAALQGHPGALDGLARALNTGDGVARDPYAAYVLFCEAAKPNERFDGVFSAQESADVIAGHMNEADRAKVKKMTAQSVLERLAVLDQYEREY